MNNPPNAPGSHFLLTSSPLTLRAYESLESHLLSNHTFRCPSLSNHILLPLTRSVFSYVCALAAQPAPGHGPLYSLSDISWSHCSLLHPPGKNCELA